jgi:23S rRNA (uracil1939-C5)-methyltransferase
LSRKYKNGDILEVSIEKIVPNGFGLAFAENLTVFVPLSVKGDKLRVKIYQLKGKSAFAEIVEILKPSDERIEPPCIYFGRCGGCNFQQMSYETQLEAKIGILRDCLSRIGKINFSGEIKIIPSPKPFEYRARAQWHIDTRSRKIGYFQRNSHRIIDVETCPIITPELNETLEDLRKNIAWESFWAEIVEIEVANSGEKVSIFSDEILEPTEEIDFQLNENKYFYSANIFFQGNPFLIESLINTAISGANGETALDLYCGVGLFSLPLAKKFAKVIGVEGFDRAVDFANKNAENAQLENVEFQRESVADFLKDNLKEFKDVDFVLLDPPRAGTEKETIDYIIRLQPKEISYVSCEPSILARDLNILTANGYEIESITAIDLFPQTHHIETIAKLKLGSVN